MIAYYRAWEHAIIDGLAKPTALGDRVELPEAQWEDYYKLTPETLSYAKSVAWLTTRVIYST